jgi:FkbM family methyltransferase
VYGLRLSLSEALLGTPFYRPVRFMYQSVFNRSEISHRAERRKLFSQFLRVGDLVFDVGANIGIFSETFLSLGAKVVAVEPDPRNLTMLKRRLGKRAYVEPCALGNESGESVLYTCQYNGVSSLSLDWVNICRADWNERVPVTVSTLDVLREKYGMPRHIKIDTENYDYEVLCGLSELPRSLNFEYHRSCLTVAEQCLARLRGRLFNFTVGDECSFQLDHWIEADEMWARLSSLPTNGDDWGDVFSIA